MLSRDPQAISAGNATKQSAIPGVSMDMTISLANILIEWSERSEKC